jgi:hypothetical protein
MRGYFRSQEGRFSITGRTSPTKETFFNSFLDDALSPGSFRLPQNCAASSVVPNGPTTAPTRERRRIAPRACHRNCPACAWIHRDGS